jgi:hypothetical protein
MKSRIGWEELNWVLKTIQHMNDGNDMIDPNWLGGAELGVEDDPTHMNDGNDMINPDVAP